MHRATKRGCQLSLDTTERQDVSASVSLLTDLVGMTGLTAGCINTPKPQTHIQEL